jgi:signal peptidase II
MSIRYCYKILFLNLFVLILFLLDQITKRLAIKKLPEEGVFIISDFLKIKLFKNYNLAFGVPLNKIVIIILILLILAVIFYLLIKNYYQQNLFNIFYLSLIIAGAISNLADRFIWGYVIDFINLSILPIFNLADLLIVFGVGFWLIKTIKYAH